MKSIFFAIALMLLISPAFADEPSYRATVDSAHQRLGALSRKFGLKKMPPAEEKESFALLGQLITQDPVWALHREVEADIEALGLGKPPIPEELATMDKLRELSAITLEFVPRAKTLAEARAFASILRQFIIRRDVDGARVWAKAQRNPSA